jgi:hypothetical protein
VNENNVKVMQKLMRHTTVTTTMKEGKSRAQAEIGKQRPRSKAACGYVFERYGRHVRIRTGDLYRVKVAL